MYKAHRTAGRPPRTLRLPLCDLSRGIGCQPRQCGDLLTVDGAQFRQVSQQRRDGLLGYAFDLNEDGGLGLMFGRLAQTLGHLVIALGFDFLQARDALLDHPCHFCVVTTFQTALFPHAVLNDLFASIA